MKHLFLLLLCVPVMVWGQGSSELPYMLKDTWATNAFGFPMNVKIFKKTFGDILTPSMKLVRNKYDSTQIDTAYSFTKGRTKIEIYHTATKDMVQSAFIENEKIKLRNGIQIGLTNPEVEKALNIKITSDKFQVGDIDHRQVYQFNFLKEKLILITFEGFLE